GARFRRLQQGRLRQGEGGREPEEAREADQGRHGGHRGCAHRRSAEAMEGNDRRAVRRRSAESVRRRLRRQPRQGQAEQDEGLKLAAEIVREPTRETGGFFVSCDAEKCRRAGIVSDRSRFEKTPVADAPGSPGAAYSVPLCWQFASQLPKW